MKSKNKNRKLKTHKGIEIKKKFKMSAEKLVEHLKITKIAGTREHEVLIIFFCLIDVYMNCVCG
jgi:hypothetical protein